MVELSKPGSLITRMTGIRSIMNDIRQGSRSSSEFINLGIGNPFPIPAIRQFWKDCADETLVDLYSYSTMGQYGETGGESEFVDCIKQYFSEKFQISLSSDNVFVATGSQSIYFYAANIFCGEIHRQTRRASLLLPCLPDYVGYGGVSMHSTQIIAPTPSVVNLSHKQFRYEIDPLNIETEVADSKVGTAFISRPSNPCGRIIDSKQIEWLSTLIGDAPLFIDNAYNSPFPALNYKPCDVVFGKNIVNTFSFSKAGLAGERVGFAIGDPRYINPMKAMQSNVCLHSSRLGQHIALNGLRKHGNDSLENLCHAVLRPHYLMMLEYCVELFEHYLKHVDWRMHSPDGGMFIWLSFDSLECTDRELYDTLFEHGLAVVPGYVFFPGVSKNWKHMSKCIRISLTVTKQELEKGLALLAKVLQKKQHARERLAVSHQ